MTDLYTSIIQFSLLTKYPPCKNIWTLGSEKRFSWSVSLSSFKKYVSPFNHVFSSRNSHWALVTRQAFLGFSRTRWFTFRHILKILLLRNLSPQCGARTYNPEIKSGTIYRLSQPGTPRYILNLWNELPFLKPGRTVGQSYWWHFFWPIKY